MAKWTEIEPIIWLLWRSHLRIKQFSCVSWVKVNLWSRLILIFVQISVTKFALLFTVDESWRVQATQIELKRETDWNERRSIKPPETWWEISLGFPRCAWGQRGCLAALSLLLSLSIFYPFLFSWPQPPHIPSCRVGAAALPRTLRRFWESWCFEMMSAVHRRTGGERRGPHALEAEETVEVFQGEVWLLFKKKTVFIKKRLYLYKTCLPITPQPSTILSLRR